MIPPPPEPRFTHYYTKVVGVTKGNRQQVIRRCGPLESLLFDSEEDNPVDPNAIKVIRQNHEQLGYIQAEMAKEIGQQAKTGYMFAVYLVAITGGEPGQANA